MLNTELITAISTMMDEKLEPIKKDIGELKTDVATLKTDVAGLKTDVAKLKTDVDLLKTTTLQLDMRSHTQSDNIQALRTDLSDLKIMVTRNHDLTVDFYAEQKEFNQKTKDQFSLLFGMLDMHARQISQNTSALKRA